MTPYKDETRLRHMLEYAQEAIEMAAGKTRSELDNNRMLSLALVRLLEVVGEAAARVSQTTQTAHPSLPWPEIIGLRNRLIHGYDAVDFDILWQIIVQDLPALVVNVQVILDSPSENEPTSSE